MASHAYGPPASASSSSWHQPAFTARNVVALMSRRAGGISLPPYDSLNLGLHVGDAPEAVAVNRARFSQALGLPLARLLQVHGRHVVRLPVQDARTPEADASISTEPGLACEIQVADCMPVLFADCRGQVVGAAHAGWRGLAAGVLEATVARMCDVAACRPADIEAWLGPCIGPARFEVGEDVVSAFTAVHAASDACFTPVDRPGTSGKWWADLPGLARGHLARAGLTRLIGNDGSTGWCTVQNQADFFSFRRDGRTGRMSAAIGLRAEGG